MSRAIGGGIIIAGMWLAGAYMAASDLMFLGGAVVLVATMYTILFLLWSLRNDK